MDTEKNILRGPPSAITLPPDTSLGQFMLDRLSTYGDRVALINGETDEQITFQEILDESCRLAVYLRNQGFKKDDRVSICSENNLNFIVAVCSAMFLGATCCPLNPGYSKREFLSSLNISKPKLIIVSAPSTATIRHLVKELPWSPKLISIGDTNFHDVPSVRYLIRSIDAPETMEIPDIDGNEHTTAILSSSGTTGLPKGVMLTDRNFLSITCQLISMASENRSADNISLHLLPFFHAYAYISMLNQVILGATAVMLTRFVPEQFLATVEKYKIQNLLLVPPLMVFLAKSPLVEKYDLSNVKQIWCGAAPLSVEIQDAVYRRLNKPLIRQGYGMTETTLSVLKCPPDFNKPGSVGTLVPNVLAKVIPVEETSKEALGPYQEGELCFKGNLIMKGYCGDEKSTSATIDEDGWLHTGDIGYYDQDGFFYIVDRLKELIKYKGYQVPPAELEGILLSHPEVLDAAVVGIPDEICGELPVGIIVKQPGSNVTPKEIVEFVNARVSTAKKLRGGVKIVKSIPKTPSGKILRRLLRDDIVKSKL